jgi:phosphate transport system permease protein
VRYRRQLEAALRGIFLFFAILSASAIVFITIFIVIEGVPLFFTSVEGFEPPSVGEFLFGTDWYPTESPPSFGILPFIVGSLVVSLGALVLAVPVGISVGIFIAEIARKRSQALLRGVTEILAGIPSVVYGFFGVIMIGFFLDRVEDPIVNYNAFSAIIILAAMVLPTVINITEVSLRSVPRHYKQGSLAMGATHWQTIWRVLLPAGRSGIIAGCILGMGRALGETMAVLMVAGNAPVMPTDGLFSRVRTLTMAIANDLGYAGGDHRVALFAIAIVLFVFILLLNLVTQIISQRSQMRMRQ